MRSSIIASALCALALTAAQAQPALHGQVTDGETHEPLVGVTVVLPAFETGTATDADGRYALDLPDAETVRVVFSYVGYRAETRTVAVGEEPVELDVSLAPTFVETPEVTVTARARASDVLSTPQSVAVVNAADLARAGGGSALDALDGVLDGLFGRLHRVPDGVLRPVEEGFVGRVIGRVCVRAGGVGRFVVGRRGVRGVCLVERGRGVVRRVRVGGLLFALVFGVQLFSHVIGLRSRPRRRMRSERRSLGWGW